MNTMVIVLVLIILTMFLVAGANGLPNYMANSDYTMLFYIAIAAIAGTVLYYGWESR